MNEDTTSSRHLSYGVWRDRLAGLCRRARWLRPHAHTASNSGYYTRSANNANAATNTAATASSGSSWNFFSHAREWETSSAVKSDNAGGPPSPVLASVFAEFDKSSFPANVDDLIASLLGEFDEVLLALRLGTRLSDSPSARVAEAQTLMHRAAFYGELQRLMAERQEELQRRPAATAAPAPVSSGPISLASVYAAGRIDPANAASSVSATASTSATATHAGNDANALNDAERAKQRTSLMQCQRNYLYCEAHDYLASSRLWLAMEHERMRFAAPTSEEALANGVLCCLTACGVLLTSGPREDESPIPLSLYRMATRAFHISRVNHNGSHHESNAGSTSHAAGGNNNGSESDDSVDSDGSDGEEPFCSVGELVPGNHYVEELLRAFPGQPIPPVHHVIERASGSNKEIGVDARTDNHTKVMNKQRCGNDDNTAAGPSLTAAGSFLCSPHVLAWDDFPPLAHHRSTRLVHALLMSLAHTLSNSFGCYEAAVNYYELAALVLLEGVPQWMWHWDSDTDEEDNDPGGIGKGEGILKTGLQREENQAKRAKKQGKRLVATKTAGSGTSPSPSRPAVSRDSYPPAPQSVYTLPSGSTTAVAATAVTPQHSGADFALERLLSESFSSVARRQQEEPATLFARMMQQMRLHEGNQAAPAASLDSEGANCAEFSRTFSPSLTSWVPSVLQSGSALSAPFFSALAAGHSPASSSPQDGPTSVARTRAQRRAAHVTAYLEAASDTVVHRGSSLPLYLSALRGAMAAATVCGDDARVLVFANAALRAMQARELALFDTLTVNFASVESDKNSFSASFSSLSAQAMKTRHRVRLPIVDHRRHWPRPVRAHAAFRLHHATHTAACHASRVFITLLASVDAFPNATNGSTTASTGTDANSSEGNATAKRKAQEHHTRYSGEYAQESESLFAQRMRLLRMYAESVDSSLDALGELAREVSAIEECLFSIPCGKRSDTDGKQRMANTTNNEKCLLVMALREQKEAAAAPVAAGTTTPLPTSTLGHSSRTPFTSTAAYQQLKEVSLHNARAQRAAEKRAKQIASMPALSSSDSDQEDIPKSTNKAATEENPVKPNRSGSRLSATEKVYLEAQSRKGDSAESMGSALEQLTASLRLVVVLTQHTYQGSASVSSTMQAHTALRNRDSGNDDESDDSSDSAVHSKVNVPCALHPSDRKRMRIEIAKIVTALRRARVTDRSVAMLAERLRQRVCYPVLAITPLVHTDKSDGTGGEC